MKLKDIAKQLANRINKEHYILHYLYMISAKMYHVGYNDAIQGREKWMKEIEGEVDRWFQKDRPLKDNTCALRTNNGLLKIKANQIACEKYKEE